MTKPFLTYAQQIEKLEDEKLLIIPDRSYAEQTLRQIGYFALISGYKMPFKNPTTKKYCDGTTFEDIVALYKFDENLRAVSEIHPARGASSSLAAFLLFFQEAWGTADTLSESGKLFGQSA